jgi:hypothetical protein
LLDNPGGTVGDYHKSLKGDTGDTGPQGPRGDTGPAISVTTATICVNNSNGNITWGDAGLVSCNPSQTAYHVAILP